MEYPVIKVREFLLTDREGVLAVFRSNVPTHFADSEEPFLEKTLEGPDGPLFVVTDSNRIVGFGGYETSDFYNRSTLVWGMVHSARHHQGQVESYSYTDFFIWPRRRIAQGTPR